MLGSVFRWVAIGCVAVLAGCTSSVIDETDDGGGGSGTDGRPGGMDGDDDGPGEPATACGVGDTELIGGGPPGPSGFPPPCSPQDNPGVNGYRCCSDDPSAVGGAKPDYMALGISDGATPYFSEARNDASRFGQCIRVGDLAGQGLVGAGVEGCPIPCNPTWPADWIDDVCGPARQCCQTVELQPTDCIVDDETGLYRPIAGDDIGPMYVWARGDHETHQDPGGSDCLEFAGGDPQAPAFQDCVRQLTVADQRGFCMALGVGQRCPLEDPGYVDACERLNAG